MVGLALNLQLVIFQLGVVYSNAVFKPALSVSVVCCDENNNNKEIAESKTSQESFLKQQFSIDLYWLDDGGQLLNESNWLHFLFVRWCDEVMLLQVLLQPGQQSGLQSTRCQSSLLLQQWLQRNKLRQPAAWIYLLTAVFFHFLTAFLSRRLNQARMYPTAK